MQQEPILWIRSKIRAGEYGFTVHSLERMIERSITRKEVEEAILNGEIIEDYPKDKYGQLPYFRIYKARKTHTYSMFFGAYVDYHLL